MPISEEGRTLEPLPIQEQQSETTGGVPNVPGDPWQSEVEEVWLPFALTDSQRRWLEGRLPHLPPLRYSMSDEEVAAFLEAFRYLGKRLAWAPVLLTAANIERRKAEQATVLVRHRKTLQAEFAGGRVIAVDDRHLPVPVLTMGSFIPREQAIAYLVQCGLAHDGSDPEPDVRCAQRLMESGSKGGAHGLGGIGAILVSSAHLLPALSQVAQPAVRRLGGMLWATCMVATGYGHATFFLWSQQHAREARAG